MNPYKPLFILINPYYAPYYALHTPLVRTFDTSCEWAGIVYNAWFWQLSPCFNVILARRRSQMRHVWSEPPVARWYPLGEKSAERTVLT